MKTLYEELKTTECEKDVENVYRKTLIDNIPEGKITSLFKTDGLFECETVRMLLEFKYDVLLKEKIEQCNVLIQTIYYIKKYEENGKKIPDLIFVGDRNECFVLHTNNVLKYLDSPIDWKIAPSKAKNYNPDVIKAMVDDIDIAPYVFDIDEQFKISDVIDKINTLSSGVVRKIRITKKNIFTIYTEFNKRLLNGIVMDDKDKVSLFLHILIEPDEHYVHINKLITKSFGKIKMDKNKFNSFFDHFDRYKYTAKEKEVLISHEDMLRNESVRRNSGEFFTPIPFVDLAHEYITKHFGENWKDEYIVWDPAAGVSNLTRDYNFKELYVSTLEKSDIETSNNAGFNPGSTKFQFDFLNDSDDKLPPSLLNAINSGKKIIILMNPPYAKSTPNKGNDNTNISNTKIGNIMNAESLQIASSQLSTQFMYRVLQYCNINKNIELCIFNKPNFLTSDGFIKFRKLFKSKYKFIDAFMFNAKHFSDTADSWGVSFSVWKQGNTTINEFYHKLYDFDAIIDKTIFIGDKYLYNCDDLKKSNVIFNDLPKNDTILPPMTSFYNIDYSKDKLGYKDSIGYINNHSNNVMQQDVIFIANSVIKANGNKPITKEIFNDVMCLFTARKVIKHNWINDKDEFLYPDVNHSEYKQFEIDSLVYALFNNSSQQSSLRNIEYKGKTYNIKNEYFWMDKETIMNLANTHCLDEIYNDAKYSQNRYVFELLYGPERLYDKLSMDAKELVIKASKMVVDSMKFREVFNMSIDNQKYQLMTFDAGYAQLKELWKVYMEDDFAEFRKMYDKFADRLRPLVYELGFLKK